MADIVGLGRAPTKPTIVDSEGVRESEGNDAFPLDIWRLASQHWHKWYMA